MLTTRITELFGIEYPIVQCAVASSSTPKLVAAVANAGGLGFLPAAAYESAEELKQTINKTKALTDRPFGLSFGFLIGRRHVDAESFFEVAKEAGIGIVEVSSRDSYRHTDLLKSWGMLVVHTCKTVKDARSSAKAGCDTVILEGVEGHGSRSDLDVSTSVLVPAAAGGLKIPIIASGGIADGRSLVAALSLGADGVAMTTRFLMTAESGAHPGVKGYLAQALEGDTILVEAAPKKSFRALQTPVSEKLYLQKKRGEKIDGVDFDADPLVTGDLSSGILSVGQAIGLIRDVPTVDELFKRLLHEAKATQKRVQLLFS